MTRSEIEGAVHETLQSVVPVAPDALDADQPFRDQFEMDSLDFLNFILALEKEHGVRIPEVHYPRCASLAGAVKVLEEAKAAPAS